MALSSEHAKLKGKVDTGQPNKEKEVTTMETAIGLETEPTAELAGEPVSNEQDSGADVQQEGDFQGEY